MIMKWNCDCMLQLDRKTHASSDRDYGLGPIGAANFDQKRTPSAFCPSKGPNFCNSNESIFSAPPTLFELASFPAVVQWKPFHLIQLSGSACAQTEMFASVCDERNMFPVGSMASPSEHETPGCRLTPKPVKVRRWTLLEVFFYIAHGIMETKFFMLFWFVHTIDCPFANCPFCDRLRAECSEHRKQWRGEQKAMRMCAHSAMKML